MSMKITLEFEERDTSLFSTIAELAVECGASSVNVDMGKPSRVIDVGPRLRRTNNNLLTQGRGIDIDGSLNAFGITADELRYTRTSKGTAMHKLKMALAYRDRAASTEQQCADARSV